MVTQVKFSVPSQVPGKLIHYFVPHPPPPPPPHPQSFCVAVGVDHTQNSPSKISLGQILSSLMSDYSFCLELVLQLVLDVIRSSKKSVLIFFFPIPEVLSLSSEQY